MPGPSAYEPLIYREAWRPVVDIGDVVALMRSTSTIIGRVRHIEARPRIARYDFGAVNAGVVQAAKQVQASNSADSLTVGADQFIQVRFRLDGTDWSASVATAASLQVVQPGPGLQRWVNTYQVADWDIQTQNYWDSLAPTELFSYYTDTPQFIVNNASLSNMANSRVWFYGWVYTFDSLQTLNAGDEISHELGDAVRGSRLGSIAWIPVAATVPRRTVNMPAF